MPQLRGPEQQELHQLLTDHISMAQLARILNFQGLPELEKLASNGNLRDQTEDVIDALSRRYQVIPLVEGSLKELDGSCPPLRDWLDRLREELTRRKTHPTFGERFEDVRQRISLVPMLVGFAALLAAIAVVTAPLLFHESNVVCRIFDEGTQQRILRPFVVSYGETTRNSVDSQCLLPEKMVGEITSVTVDGYISGKPDVEPISDGQQPEVRLFMRRDHSNNNFLNSILPDFSSITGLPSDEVIRLRTEKNSIPAQEVTFLVHNETDYVVDVLLYYLPPSGHPDSTNPFLARTQLIERVPERLKGDGWSEPFDKFRLDAGFFAIFVSHSGRDARLVTSDALYKNSWAVLHLTKAEDTPVGRLEFFSSDPRPK